MPGSDWGRRSESCCKTLVGNMAVSTAWKISRGPATSSTTGVWNVLCHTCQEQKKWWENVIFTIHVISRLTALLSWAASLGWTSAVTCCNVYREYHEAVPPPQFFCFYVIIRTLILLVPSLKLSFIWSATTFNSRIVWMTVFASFCLNLFNM